MPTKILDFRVQQMVFSLVMYSAGGCQLSARPPIPGGQCQTLFLPNLNTLSVPQQWRKAQQIVSPIPGHCQTLFYKPSSGQATSSEPNFNIFPAPPTYMKLNLQTIMFPVVSRRDCGELKFLVS